MTKKKIAQLSDQVITIVLSNCELDKEFSETDDTGSDSEE